MVKTAKELAEMFEAMPPGDLVWVYWYAKDEVEIYNSPDGEHNVVDEDWKAIVNEIGEPPEQLYEYFSQAVSSQISQYSCEGCYNYDYTTREIDSEKRCQQCGEENDLLA
jgi:hypothetical protein